MLRSELPSGAGLMLLTGISLEKRAEAGDEKYAEPSVFSRWALREWGSGVRMNANPESTWLDDGQKRGFFKFAADDEQPARSRKSGLVQALRTGALAGGVLGGIRAAQGVAKINAIAHRYPDRYEDILQTLIPRLIKAGMNPVTARRQANIAAKAAAGYIRGKPSGVRGFLIGTVGSLLIQKLRQRKQQTGEVT